MNDVRRSDEPIFLDDAAEPIFEDDLPPHASPAETSALPPAQKLNAFQWVVGIILLVALLSACGYFIGRPLVRMGLPRFLAYPFGSILTLLSLFVLAGLTDKRARAAFKEIREPLALIWKELRPFSVRLMRDYETIDLRAARHAAKTRGKLTRHGPISLWTDAPDGATNECLSALQTASEHFRNLTGIAVDTAQLRAISFSRESAFADYTVRIYPALPRVGGYYSGLWHKRIVINAGVAIMPSDFQQTVAHEFTHHLLRSTFKRSQSTWIEEGIATAVAGRVGISYREPQAALRLLRAQRLQGRLLTGEQLIKMQYSDLFEHMNAQDVPFVYGFYMQSAYFCRWLHELDVNAFRQFLLAQSNVTSMQEHFDLFSQFFRQSPDEAMAAWEQKRLNQALPDHLFPDPPLQDLIQQKLIRPILESGSDEEGRRHLISRLGFLGYTWRCDVLVDLLDDSNEKIRDEALFALANISGENLGTDRAAWRRWYESLPQVGHDIPGERPV